MSQALTSAATAAGGILAGLAASGLWALRLRILLSHSRNRVATLNADLAEMVAVTRQLREERDTAYRLAHHDETTGLPNRRAVITRITEAVTTGDPVGVVVLDLTRFKEINDRLGHRTGNTLLAQVGARLTRLTGESVYAARLSGDEFALLVHGDDRATGLVAETAWQAVSGVPFVLDEHHTVDIAASAGYATTTQVGADPEALLHRADVAMYWAKARGGGVRGYHDRMGSTPAGGRPRDWLPTQRR